MISLVATVRAPRGDLARFVAYHLNTGVDHIDLFFDDPADPALDAFTGLDRVSAIPCTPQHWQAAGISPAQGIEARQLHNAALALGRARASGVQWLLHVDSDELIYTPGDNLAAWLAARPADINGVIFPVLEAIPHTSAHHPFEACRMFKAVPQPDPARLDLATRLGCRRALRYGYFRGHLLGKAATRVTVSVDAIGIHFPTRAGPPLQLESAADAFVLHYDGCTFEGWHQKWARRNDGTGLALAMRPDRRRQFTDFLAANASGDRAELKREFRRQCMIPVHEQAILWALGLACPIHLDRALFNPPWQGA